MIQQLMALLPREINAIAVMIAIVGAFFGGILWLAGSKFNRTLVTLISVSAGALIGLNMPAWFGWALEGWATAVLGALVFGISGYVLHKVWVGLGLGLVLMAWAALGTFAMTQGELAAGPDATGKSAVVIEQARPWVWPAVTAQTTVRSYAGDVWNSFAAPIRRVLPVACGVAMLAGLLASILWPRIGVVLLYSSAGISLVIGMGVAVLTAARPQWLGVIPSRTSSQMMVLVSMVAFGAIVQWRSVPGQRRAAGGPSHG